MNILVVRFRQMGDAVLSTVLLNSLRKTWPEAQIDFVLNDRLAALFESHPSVSRVIAFTEQERHSPLTYIRKVWRTVHQTRYDVIIDMRSTVNTLPFALFSRRTKYRIGLRKAYTAIAFNHRIEPCRTDESMVQHNLKMLQPLAGLRQLQLVQEFTLAPTNEETASFRDYMQSQGIDFGRPVMLAGVATRVPSKSWGDERMAWVLARLAESHPQLQVVLNYAPGAEEESARRILDAVCAQCAQAKEHFFMNIAARSQRELTAMAACCTFYFGNEGGARHIVQAMRRPSLCICAPGSSSVTWIPQNGIPAEAIDSRLLTDADSFAAMNYEQRYQLISKELVWERLNQFVNTHASLWKQHPT